MAEWTVTFYLLLTTDVKIPSTLEFHVNVL
jgi:hypothetical protein